jgi:hypothetical protein
LTVFVNLHIDQHMGHTLHLAGDTYVPVYVLVVFFVVSAYFVKVVVVSGKVTVTVTSAVPD